jgi:hypothetical protein
MQNGMIERLRSDFRSAISADYDAVDSAIAGLRDQISASDFVDPLSIYSRAHLRKIDDALARIGRAGLRDDPLQVAIAVESVLELLARLETTVRQSAASARKIEANRVT